MAKEIPARGTCDPKYQWHLTDIFADSAAFEAAFGRAKETVKALEAFQSRAAERPLDAITLSFSLSRQISLLYSYAMMNLDQDSGNAAAQALLARVSALAVDAQSAGAFLEPELLTLPAETLRAMAEAPEYRDYRVFLTELLRRQPHTLPAPEEKLLASAGEVLRAPGEVFDMFDDLDIPFPDVMFEDGEKGPLSHANYGPLIRSRDRSVRQGAFEAMMGTFGKFASTVTAMYSGNLKGDIFLMKARRFSSCREMSLYQNQIPEAVYDSLIKAVSDAIPAMNRALRIRKEYLGLDTLHMWDLYAPIIADFDRTMDYAEAYDTVLAALKPLGEEYLSLLRRARDEGWIDVFPNRGKRSGAYSNSAYGVHPYVLLNHVNNLESCSTLAHELGHALHTWYTEKNQPFPTADYSLFVAEVASTTNEVLLTRYLLDKFAEDPKATAFLCNQFIESFRTTVFRQTMFAEFEWQAHVLAEKGEPVTKESLTKLYLGLNKKYYGAVCEVDEPIGWEWMRIPHFYRSFYVYVYATGYCAAVAIADRILREGEEAVAGYKRFLSAGSSVPPIEALRFAGVDMNDPATVASALQVFADTVERLEKVLRQ